VRWGEATDTDDAEGEVIERSEARPREAIEAALPQFTGTIVQVPPRFSAIKLAGERAYDLARDGETVDLEPRDVEVTSLGWSAVPDPTTPSSRPNAAKGRMCAPSRAIWAAFWAVSAMSRPCAAPKSAHLGPIT
jgi:tRNA pseudouridine55 synthase